MSYFYVFIKLLNFNTTGIAPFSRFTKVWHYYTFIEYCRLKKSSRVECADNLGISNELMRIS